MSIALQYQELSPVSQLPPLSNIFATNWSGNKKTFQKITAILSHFFVVWL